jgi:hypothetical protein
MYKIAICGRANSGKNSLSSLIDDELCKLLNIDGLQKHNMAFADPIKQIIKMMFPDVPNEWLYGPSEARSNYIRGAFNNGDPLTVRQCLIDIGQFYKKYNQNIWIDNFDYRLNELDKNGAKMVIATDLRFINEFNYLKSKDFKIIKLYRNESLNINHPSETEQDGIQASQFDYIVYNNGSLDDLRSRASEIAANML